MGHGWRTGWMPTRLAVCLVALRRPALLAAQAEFAAGRVRKVYWAIVRGIPSAAHGTIDASLARRSTRNGWHMEMDPAGKTAITDWRVLGHYDELTWLELSPRTGRTHQVRVHCALLGCPVLGDAIYGGGTGALHLLARQESRSILILRSPQPRRFPVTCARPCSAAAAT